MFHDTADRISCATLWTVSRKHRSRFGAGVLASSFALSAALLGACGPPPPGADAATDSATEDIPLSDLAVRDNLASAPDLPTGSNGGDLASSSDLAGHLDLATPAAPACSPSCGNGKACVAAADCAGLKCDHGLCATNPCLDGHRNGNETDTDCGGGACPRCGLGKRCSAGGDCLSGQCKAATCAGGLALSFAPIGLSNPNFRSFSGGSVSVGDFNGDQVPDLVTAGLGSLNGQGNQGGMTVWLSDGKGGFGPGLSDFIVWNQNPHFGPAMCWVSAVGDLNGDGKLDAVPDCSLNDNFGFYQYLCLGDGLGRFGIVCDQLMTPPYTEGVGDWNADKNLDLSYRGQVFLGNGKRAFVPQNPPVVPAYFCPVHFAGDLNGDQRLDSVLADSCPDPMQPLPPISILLGKGDGTFDLGRELPTEGGILAVADMNADGRLDVILFDANGLSTRLGLGDGTFGPAIASSAAMPDNTWRTIRGAVADFNGDGAPDIATVSGLAFTIFLGGGDGTFKAVPIPPAPFFVSVPEISAAPGIAATDFNRDGKTDLAVFSWNPAAVVFFNTSH